MELPLRDARCHEITDRSLRDRVGLHRRLACGEGSSPATSMWVAEHLPMKRIAIADFGMRIIGRLKMLPNDCGSREGL